MKKSGIIVLIIILSMLLAAACGFIWYMSHYVRVDSVSYPRDLQVLDMRSEELSVSQYEKLQNSLPECRILWNIPLQGGLYSNDTAQLTLPTLTDTEVGLLPYFEKLGRLTLEQTPSLPLITAIRETCPDLQLEYTVTVNGTAYNQDTHLLQLDNISQGDLEMLPALTKLNTVAISGAENLQTASDLVQYCKDHGITFCITLGAETYALEADQVTAHAITEAQIALLELMPNLKKVHLTEPEASADTLLALRSRGLTVTWQKSIWGISYNDTAEEIDLSEGTVGTLEEVELGMTYLPNAKHLFLGFCGLDNESIAQFRERSRESFKVVWVVDLSGKMQVRTDITNFMPSRDGWGYVRDGEIDNIRYCEDLICIDIGHMGVKDVSFLEPLVNLEYLILAHTEVQYIDAIVNCKKLKFLELDWSCIRDISPLVECTALEDLNLGMTWPDITPVLQMTWLKNLYIIKGNCKANFAEHLPNTRVVTSGAYTVSSGWRNLPNYYAMRDILGMHYM
ncbi:MAG: hypothetical protein J6V25_07090 [Oscillospiraceae bacterium]|nr:hypothetical protein [Oscillospiraceae bacterium]